MSARRFLGNGGRPECRDFQHQNRRNPARCQRTNVSGLTIARALAQGKNRLRITRANFAGGVWAAPAGSCAPDREPVAAAGTDSRRSRSSGSKQHANKVAGERQRKGRNQSALLQRKPGVRSISNTLQQHPPSSACGCSGARPLTRFTANGAVIARCAGAERRRVLGGERGRRP